MVDDLGQVRSRAPGLTVHPRSASKGPLSDSTGDGGAVDAEPAGQHVVRGTMAEMHERGQEPVDEHQPVLPAGAHGPLPRPGHELGVVPFMPQRAHLGSEFSDHVGRQTRDPPVADDHCTRSVPHHTTMIDDQEPDASPPTVHDLVSLALSRGGVSEA